MTQEDFRKDDNDSVDEVDADLGWERLADIIEEFCQSWESAPPEPEFDAFAKRLQEIPGEEFLQIGLVELVKVDFEYRARDNFQWKPLEDYLTAWPALGPPDSPPTDLVYEEYQHRAKKDLSLQVEEYQSRFPDNYHRLLQIVSDDTLIKTISVFRSKNLNEFEPGNTIDDFDLLFKLGRGAFAVVFLARQNSMQRLVALKISADTGLEGQTLAQLDHPHIVRVFDQRTLPEENLRLMYMQYIAGGSLADLISLCHSGEVELSSAAYLTALDTILENAGQTQPVESSNREWIAKAEWSHVVSRIGSQIASALEYAHQHNVLHRDLKPANILVDRDGYPKLVDFNVSFSKDVVGATASTFFGGSLAYMSLEQLEAMNPKCQRQAEDLTGACDVYSLGILMFELLTGKRPFQDPKGGDPGTMISDFVDVRTGGLPESARNEIVEREFLLVQAIERALEPDPEKRITPKALKKQLEWAANSQANQFLSPPSGGWREWVSWVPFATVILISFLIAIFATWFIISYNLEEAITDHDERLYLWVRRTINIVTFNGGMAVLYLMFFKANKVLKNPSSQFSTDEIHAAIRTNLNFGHWAAVLFVMLWTVAGMMYPVGLSLFGVELPPMAWLDFIGSHMLAGLTTGAYVFCGVTCCSLAAWHARLVRTAMRHDVWPNVEPEVKKLRWRVSFYQVLAVATPLASIAVLINWRQPESTAVGVLSTAAFIGLAFLSWTLRKINNTLDVLAQIATD